MTPAMDGVAELYKKIGHDTGGEWRDFGFDRDKMKWYYHTFDRPEKIEWRPGARALPQGRFPSGMAKGYGPGFDPVAAGRKEGLSPFVQNNGPLRTEHPGGNSGICGRGASMNTFWDKEVLPIKGGREVPPMKAGHTYRLLTGGIARSRGGVRAAGCRPA